jgi:hypothetical protein
MSSHFVLLRVRLAGRRPKPAADGTIPLTWLIAQWPDGETEPVKYWISNLPETIPAKDLIRLAKSRWRIEHDHRELKAALGLDHFEGRSFTGWHRHVTLVTAAHLFLTEERTHPKAPARACPSTRPWQSSNTSSPPGPAPAPPADNPLHGSPTTPPMTLAPLRTRVLRGRPRRCTHRPR